jgi:hypothetical protein
MDHHDYSFLYRYKAPGTKAIFHSDAWRDMQKYIDEFNHRHIGFRVVPHNEKWDIDTSTYGNIFLDFHLRTDIINYVSIERKFNVVWIITSPSFLEHELASDFSHYNILDIDSCRTS